MNQVFLLIQSLFSDLQHKLFLIDISIACYTTALCNRDGISFTFSCNFSTNTMLIFMLN